MKKLALTLSLAAILTVGSTQANAGIIIGGVAQPTQCENVDKGIIIGGLTEQEKKDGKGIIIGGFACEEEKGIFDIIWDSVTGIIIGG
jgi:hypothetical protein